MGDVNFKGNPISNFPLPPSIPSSVRKVCFAYIFIFLVLKFTQVLFFVYVRTGTNAHPENDVTFRIFTRGDSGVEYSNYVSLISFVGFFCARERESWRKEERGKVLRGWRGGKEGGREKCQRKDLRYDICG